MSQQIEETPTIALLDGRYQLIETVGEGATAQVYRAEDTMLGRSVAIKMLRGEADGLNSPERARGEVNALVTVTHPSLVTLLDASLAPGRPRYLVMEFVEGSTLSHRLREGPLPPAEVAHLAEQLAAGLSAVHGAGIVHRDVKPSNVLLAPSPLPAEAFHAKLADFGLARLVDSAGTTTPGVIVGTAAYLAPEQVRGEAAGPPADIYALGLMMLEALTGERAFGHASGIGAVMARLVEPPLIPDRIGTDWASLLQRMTHPDPDHRPDAIEVGRSAARLREWLSAPPLIATSPQKTATASARVVAAACVAARHRAAPGPQMLLQRHRSTLAASFAAVAVLIPLLTLLLVSGSQQARSGAVISVLPPESLTQVDPVPAQDEQELPTSVGTAPVDAPETIAATTPLPSPAPDRSSTAGKSEESMSRIERESAKDERERQRQLDQAARQSEHAAAQEQKRAESAETKQQRP